jgi:multiple sugar transport system substrate-binding protein
MIIWSPYILDELSGLRSDIPIIPDMIHGKPGYLAANTGFVTKIHGPKGAAQYGQLGCFGITRSANKSSAEQWVMFLLTEGYLDWLSMAPAGKLPVRKGTRTNPNFFTEAWKELEIGVTARAKISELYGRDVIRSIVDSATDFDRWGISRDKGGIVARIYETKIIPHILGQYLDDSISATQAARIMDERVKALELSDRNKDE